MLLSVGKPLMDILVEVDDNFLNKYGLKPNDAVKATESQAKIFQDILQLNPKFNLGGSVTNTLRVFQWAMSNKEKIFYIGVIGTDKYGLQIKTQLEQEKIDYCFLENSTETVQCAVLISKNGKNRSLVTNTNLISTQIISNQGFYDDFRDQLVECTCFYVPTFSLVMFAAIIKEIVDVFISNQKKIIVNLGATYILKKYSDSVMYLIKHADVIIGNDEEFKTLANILNILTQDLQGILVEIKLFLASIKDTIFIVTRGHQDIIVYANESFKHFNVKPVEQIVDTTGAGDAFAGGFLTQYMKNVSLENCIYCGIACASHIIQHIGCDFNLGFNRNNLFRTKI